MICLTKSSIGSIGPKKGRAQISGTDTGKESKEGKTAQSRNEIH